MQLNAKPVFFCFVFRSELYGAFYETTKAPENQKGKTTQGTGSILKHTLN